MNTSRIIGGGLLAGLVLNIGETILNTVVLGTQMDAALQKLGVQAMGGSTIALFVVMCFLLGIFSVWLYAVLRSHFGAGPATAIKTGLIVWLLAFVWPNVGVVGMGIMPARLVVMGVLWELVEIPLAVLAGAWVYREEVVGSAAMAR